MKKWITSLWALANFCIIFASTTKSVNLKFTKEQFSFENNTGLIQITPLEGIYSFEEDYTQPGLPYFTIGVYVYGNNEYRNCEIDFKKSLLFNDCVISQTPILEPASTSISETKPVNTTYEKEIYPDNNIKFAGESNMGDYKIIYFKICPFIYNNIDKELYLASDINLHINLCEDKNFKKQKAINSIPAEKLQDLVINAKDVPLGLDTIASSEYMTNNLDYAIITNKSLEDSFIPLRNWKRQKGIWTEIITIEDIENKYTGNSMQEKIKQCLYSLYKNRQLKYVLLGGDDYIIPVRYCKSSVTKKEDGTYKYNEYKMPTDLYYSCFMGAFDWDGNGNGVYGEPSDGINLQPNIFLTRLPIRTNEEAESYIEKILSYENMKDTCLYTNKMLMGGYLLSSNYGACSDAEFKSDILYKNYIYPFWKGQRRKLFDTHSDFDLNKTMSGNTLEEQLSNGYAFIDIITHGLKDKFCFGNNDSYNTIRANRQSNSGFTVITTMACTTNAFDDSYTPSLSESLIRNPDSGVIGYLGSSRYGWFYKSTQLGPSLQYESKFYKNLFSSKYANKNFGKIVAFSKLDLEGLSHDESSFRWLQFGLNPIGDPEMPLFTTSPKEQRNPKVNINGNSLEVRTETDSCTICLMSTNDYGVSYYAVKNNVKNATFDNIVDSMSLCITKQNYIPKVIHDVRTYAELTSPGLAGSIIGVGKKFPFDDIIIKYHIDNNERNAYIIATDSDGSKSKIYPVSGENDSIRIPSNQFGRKILSFSLFVKSKFMNSINYNNK